MTSPKIYSILLLQSWETPTKTKQTLKGDKTMKKEYGEFDANKIQKILSKWDLNKINEEKSICEQHVKNDEFPIKNENGKWYNKDYFVSMVAAMDAEISRRTYTPNTIELDQETDVPAPVVEIPIPTMAEKTATGTSNAGEKNVKKVLQKKSPKSVDKPKKNCYINGTNKTEGRRPDGHKTTKTGDKTMFNKNEIAKIGAVAVKNIMAAQKKNKTNTKKTYWGGWETVHAGMNAASNDYAKYNELRDEWLELCQKLGGRRAAKYHFCWGLINKNRVGVKQEPNATLRFIKNVKIRIAMANDVLNGKYTKKQIDDYMNSLSDGYKQKYKLV